jgi:hypothetical protein
VVAHFKKRKKSMLSLCCFPLWETCGPLRQRCTFIFFGSGWICGLCVLDITLQMIEIQSERERDYLQQIADLQSKFSQLQDELQVLKMRNVTVSSCVTFCLFRFIVQRWLVRSFAEFLLRNLNAKTFWSTVLPHSYNIVVNCSSN